jgi:Bacterial SH3 domain
MVPFRCFVLATLVFASGIANAQEVGSLNREATLLAQASAGATIISTLPKGTNVRVLERAAGGWMRVDIQGRLGWIRALQYSPVPQVQAGSPPGFVAQMAAAASAPKGTIGTVGVRGLSEEDMKKATPNGAEFAKYKGYALNKAQGEQFGQANRLQAARLPYLNERGQPLAKSPGA